MKIKSLIAVGFVTMLLLTGCVAAPAYYDNPYGYNNGVVVQPIVQPVVPFFFGGGHRFHHR